MEKYELLRAKITALKALVEDNSITPVMLGNLLDDLISDIDEQIETLKTDITHPVSKRTVTGSDLDFADESGNIVARIAQGHIKTKNFDSSNIRTEVETPVLVGASSASDLDVMDASGNVLARFKNGHVRTKNFDSSSLNPVNDIVAENDTAAFRSAMPTIKSCNLRLLAFADVHGDTTNYYRLKQWKQKYADLINDVINLGDTNNTDCRESITWYEDKSILTVIGNHDIYTSGMSGDIGESECQTRYMPKIHTWGVYYEADKCYYYKDYSNIRLIVLDSMHWNSTQNEWFTTKLNEAKAASKKVIVAMHHPAAQYNGIDCSFNTKDSISTEYGNAQIPQAVQAFIDAGGTFITYISGHSHNDIVGTLRSYTSQLLISVDSATLRTGNKDVRTVGTKAQDAFELVCVDTTRNILCLVRVGNTNDRYLRHKNVLTINYVTKEVIANY